MKSIKNLFINAVEISKEISKAKIEEGDIVIDATMGNGNDTALLCELVGEEGKVYAFDIQKKAIESTKKRIKKLNFENRSELIHDGHENIDKYVDEKVKLIIYNLGYLPCEDHKITTKSDTTIKSVKKGLDLLDQNSVILIIIYPGHESGMLEKIAIEDFTEGINQKEFNVVNIKFTNQINNPPELICIEKR